MMLRYEGEIGRCMPERTRRRPVTLAVRTMAGRTVIPKNFRSVDGRRARTVAPGCRILPSNGERQSRGDDEQCTCDGIFIRRLRNNCLRGGEGSPFSRFFIRDPQQHIEGACGAAGAAWPARGIRARAFPVVKERRVDTAQRAAPKERVRTGPPPAEQDGFMKATFVLHCLYLTGLITHSPG
jgi:hypothetical protein